MFIFDSIEDEFNCLDLILANKICANCSHNHNQDICDCVIDRPTMTICKCSAFKAYEPDFHDMVYHYIWLNKDNKNKLAEQFECAINTVERWAYNVAAPLPAMKPIILKWISEQK